MKKIFLILFLLFAVALNSQSILWKEVSKSHLESKSKQVRPSKYKVYQLDLQLLKEELKKVQQRENINLSNLILSFPDENGVLKQYKIAEASVMAAQLQENHPTIKSYIGKPVGHSGSIIRFSISPYTGFNGIILNNTDSPTLIERDENYYQVFSEKDFPAQENSFECSVIDQVEFKIKKNSSKKKTLIDSKLRTYRLALATTGEYSQYILNELNIQNSASDTDKKSAMLGHLNRIMTNVNAVFERDLSVRMELVSNNIEIIFLDPETDGLDNNSDTENLSNMNQEICDRVIGNSNYDIGHLIFNLVQDRGSGIASLKSVCANSSKAKAVSTGGRREGNLHRYYRVLLHEMGHQFGARHTFNIPLEINNNESVEINRGLTIMSYAENDTGLFFHSVSVSKMSDFIQNTTCATITNTGNTPPTANAGNDFTIPKLTPFLLEGIATDSDSSNLTYTWEQIDSEKGIFPLRSVAPKGPVFNWVLPSLEPKRYMPNISTILDGEMKNIQEVLPSVSRDMNFAFFVRDNDMRGGETDSDQMKVTVDSNSGPFLITSNNSPTTWYSGLTKTVSWDVANTNSGAVNTPTVDILFSADGGLTYPTTLADNVANDGSYSFTIPRGISTTEGRFMIKANGNLFLDVNNADITVEEREFLVNISDEEKEKSLCSENSNSIFYNFTYNSYLGFNGTVNFSADSLNGTSISFSPDSTNTDGDNITMTISNISSANIGSNIISINASTDSDSFVNSVTLNIYNNSLLNPVNLVSPSNGAVNILEPFTFQWNAENNSESYRVQISADDSFSNIVEEADVTNNSFVPTSLNYNTTYYWRVKTLNACVGGLFSNIFSFTTPEFAHANDTYIPDDVFEQVLIDLGFDTGVLDNYVPTRVVKNMLELLIPDLNIRNLTGIEDFTALTYLDCGFNSLTSLDLSKNTMLTRLDCSGNGLTDLDLSKNTMLTRLDCSGNGLTDLDLSKNTMLTRLNFSANRFMTVDLSKNTALTDLYFALTKLKKLDLSKNTKLIKLGALHNSSLTSLNLKNGNNTILTDFSLFRNAVSCIQVDNAQWSTDNWTKKDSHSYFSESCSSLSNEDFQLTSISVSPNPITSILYIENTSNIKIERVKIFNLLGQLIYNKENKNNQVNLSYLSKDFYILKLIDFEGKSIIKKIIKK